MTTQASQSSEQMRCRLHKAFIGALLKFGHEIDNERITIYGNGGDKVALAQLTDELVTAAIAAQTAQVVPEGWKLFPPKLTPKMEDVLEFGRKQPTHNTYLNLWHAAPPQAIAAVTDEQMLELDVLLGQFHEAVWNVAQSEAPEYDLAGVPEAKAIQAHVRKMVGK